MKHKEGGGEEEEEEEEEEEVEEEEEEEEEEDEEEDEEEGSPNCTSRLTSPTPSCSIRSHTERRDQREALHNRCRAI